MIDSLIKDADSALNSKPSHHKQRTVMSQVQLDDLTDLPSSRDPYCSPEQLSSVSTVFEDIPALQERPSSSRRSAVKHYGLGGYRHGDIIPQRPASAMSTSSRSRRRRPQTPVIVSRLNLRADPSEADAESDTGIEPTNYSVRSRARSNSRSQSRSSYASHDVQQSRYHETASHQHYQNYPHTQYQNQQHSYHNYARHRSDTLDSFLSNSSETCVSPGNRISREFYRTPMSHMYAGSDALVDSLCTPTRRNFDFGFANQSPRFRDVHRDSQTHTHIDTTPSSGQRSEFPRLYTDDQLDRQHSRGHSLFPDLHASDNAGSPISGSNVPFIRRFRNSVSRAALRTASFVDDSVNNDIAALAATSNAQSLLRPRSNTVTSDRPEPYFATMSTSGRMSAEPIEYGCLGSPLASRSPRNGNVQSEPLATLWTRRQNQSLFADLQKPNLRINTADIRKCPLRGSDIIEECESNGSKECSPLNTSSESPNIIATSPASPADAANMNGIFGMVSLLYWTLLFTLGALMLDSFLCQVAGKRVMGTVDKISQSDVAHEKDKSKKGEVGTKPTDVPRKAEDGNDNINVANTFGRFVRWYIEGPDDRTDGNNNIANHEISDRKSRVKPSLGLSNSELNIPRARKPSAMRGSFKHIE
ncbi:hypothetical protein GGI05_002328 [Coemansia sp. RSA 2603]|nr:hypothetical protein GGI05_002328 [Coemansia sp. RSA 2603]